MNTLQKCAEILVKCGYAKSAGHTWDKEGWANGFEVFTIKDDERNCLSGREACNPFADTLEGRRQADAIEDWLMFEYSGMWCSGVTTLGNHQWRLDRIKWCIEELIK